jgi:ATPase subunit of ABC transporter with duplicated ATPase domains
MIVSNLKKEINGVSILSNVNFTLNEKEKLILLGANGAGKSTLLKILNGDLKYDNGSISLNNESISMLKQEICKSDYNQKIIDYIKKETGESTLESRLSFLENNLNDENMDEYGEILNAFLKIDGYNFENRINEILNGLNFHENVNKFIGELSGGEKIKILLAIVLLKNTDIVLLDEPTNNLDLDAIKYLEETLVSSKQKMIIVSHDEEFISKIGTKILVLHDGIIDQYNMNYDQYLIKKEQEYNQALLEHEKREEEKAKLKSAFEKAKTWESKGLNQKSNDNDKIAAGYQKERTKTTSGKISKIKADLEKLNVDDGFREKTKINFFVNTSSTKESMDIVTEDLICGYTDFKTPKISITIPFGTRIQIAGSNGSGKTTFIKTILGINKPVNGKVLIGKGVKFGYISQDSFDMVNNDESVEQFITKSNNIDKSFIYMLLDKFSISYDDKDKIYARLSPGERTKINLAKLAMNNVNVLVLDEVTNHLDIESIGILDDVIDSFDGTIISISHNRRFIEKLNPEIVLDIKTGNINYRKCVNKKLI